MYNLIEERKRLVLERLQKSFDNEVVEKAYQVGDEKQFNGRNYYVHALNSKGQPLWRLKRDGAKKDEEGGGDKKVAKPEENKSMSDHASEASDEALKRAAADEKAKPEVREAAKKELEKRNSGGNSDSVKEKPSKAKRKFIKDVFEQGGSSSLDRFMEKNEKHFSEVLKKHGFDSWDDFQKYGEDGPDDYDKIWKKCANAIPNSVFDSSSESKTATNENDLKNDSSSNNGSVSEDDVKTFLTQKLGADNIDDRLISGVMEAVKNNAGKAKTTKKQREKEVLSEMDDAARADYSRYKATADLIKHPTDRIRMNMHTSEIQEELKHLQKFVDDYEKNHKRELDYIRGDEEAEKKAAANKRQYIKDLKNNGSGKETSAFLSKNQEYFKDVLKKHGFDSFEDFEDWGADGADDDWGKYDKIFFQCLKKIPDDKFPNIKKANSYGKLESVSDLIEEIRNNGRY